MKKYIAIGFAFAALTACKKDDNNGVDNTLPATILTDFSTNVSQAVYNDLSGKTAALYDASLALQTNTNDANLEACRTYWKDARKAWECSEGFLFGPVSTENIDPRIDTWPVNFQDLENVLASSATFDAAYIDGLEDALRGFHPIEYLLWGQDGNKTAADFTARELDFLVALSANVKTLTADLAAKWNPANQGNYSTILNQAGSGSTIYTTKRAAFEEIVGAMAGICEEVAGGKMSEPFLQQDATLEESPFAKNSITDFTNNINSVEIAYKGHYTADGKGLEDFVRQYNLSLDSKIKTQIAAAKTALGNITVPFGQAIFSQPQQVQTAITAIETLGTTLNEELLPLVQLHTN